MGHLELDGASIYYEEVGNGPVLLCISGAQGVVEVWRQLAQQLKQHFTVIIYDRRGFSRSYLSGAQDYAHRVETDASDAASLIRHFSPDQPATVIGNSSGAVVALQLLAQSPEVVKTVISYEPPAVALIPDCEEVSAEFRAIYDTYRRAGMTAGMEHFAAHVRAGPESAPLVDLWNPRNGPYQMGNGQYWFERELLVYTAHKHDLEALKRNKAKLILINGELTDPEAAHVRTNPGLAKKLGIPEVVRFPGAHMGHVSHSESFAKRLIEVLGG